MKIKITTHRELVVKMLNALPFANHERGLDETATLIKLLYNEMIKNRQITIDLCRDLCLADHTGDMMESVNTALCKVSDVEFDPNDEQKELIMGELYMDSNDSYEDVDTDTSEWLLGYLEVCHNAKGLYTDDAEAEGAL